LSKVLVKAGAKVKRNQPLFIIEAMKMETTVTAPADGTVQRIALSDGTLVETDDLVVVMEV
jgi:pyruvate carboxylase